jgi:hypothetical protein
MSAVAEPLAEPKRDDKHFEGARLRPARQEPEHAVDTEPEIADAPAAAESPPADPIDDLPIHQVIRLLRSPAPGHAANTSTRASAARRVQRSHGNRATRQIVMRAPILRRECACGGTCAKCQEEEEQRALQRSSASPAPLGFDGIPSTQGEPLEAAARRPLEAHFGADLADVRVHTGSAAAESATKLDALAYTSGRDIYFAEGMYAPSSRSGQRLLAHEVAHVVQQGSGKEPSVAMKSSGGVKIGAPDAVLETDAEKQAEQFMSGSPTDEEQRKKRESSGAVQRFIQRQSPPGAPAPAPADQAGAGNSVVYDGDPLSPVNSGITLSTDSDAAHGSLEQMVIEHGEKAADQWVNVSLKKWIQVDEDLIHAEEERQRNSSGDVSGAPLPPERKALIPVKKNILGTFTQQWTAWEAKIKEIHQQLDQNLTDTVSALLDESEQQILAESIRYGIQLEGPEGVNPAALGIQLPVPSEAQKKGLKAAAKQLLELWKKRDQAKITAQALLTPPWDLIDIDREFALQRKNLTTQYPVLAAYSTNREKLAELASDSDPTHSLRVEMNKRLDNIAWVRAGMREHLLPVMRRDPGLRNSAKANLGFKAPSVANRVIEDDAAAEAASQEDLDRLNSVIGVGLLIISFIPGLQVVGLVGGLAMGAADIYSKFQEYTWEEAASGTAFDRAFAISQSDPSLFRLGLEIAVGIATGVVEGVIIGEAIKAFKVLAPLVHEAVAARFAGAIAADAATAEASNLAMSRLREQAGPGLGDRLQAAIDHGDFGEVGAGKIIKGSDAAGAFHQEIADLPDAFGGGPHKIGIGERGLERCSGACPLFADSLAGRAENIQRVKEASTDILDGASSLRSRAESLGARAKQVEAMPEPARAAAETKLLQDARKLELEMTALEHEVLGFSSARVGDLPEGGQWSGTPSNSNWTPPKGSRAAEFTGGKPIPFHNGFPNFTEFALPGGDVNLPNMKGTSADFGAADAIAAKRAGMKNAAEFKAWRQEAGYTWHHRENSMTMQLVPTPLHAGVPHLGGAWVARGV